MKKRKRGLRQGDPLPPFLFDLIADALNKVIWNATQGGYLKGLGKSHNGKGLVNFHFADDTVYSKMI